MKFNISTNADPFLTGLVFGFDVGTGSIGYAVRRGSTFLPDGVGVLICDSEGSNPKPPHPTGPAMTKFGIPWTGGNPKRAAGESLLTRIYNNFTFLQVRSDSPAARFKFLRSRPLKI